VHLLLAPSSLAPLLLPNRYHRVQNFLFRLLRVETVSRLLFTTLRNYISSSSSSVPATLLSSINLLRFEMTHFVSSLTCFVFGTAISRNWKVFMRRLERLRGDAVRQEVHPTSSRPRRRRTSSSSSSADAVSSSDLDNEDGEDDSEPNPDSSSSASFGITDIHSLRAYHSTVLDRILSSCFLKQRQEVLYKLLMAVFRSVLDFGKLLRDGLDEERLAAAAVRNGDEGEEGWNVLEERVRKVGKDFGKASGRFVSRSIASHLLFINSAHDN
jgi:hypothetical protein